jgi:hypothetical protein
MLETIDPMQTPIARLISATATFDSTFAPVVNGMRTAIAVARPTIQPKNR